MSRHKEGNTVDLIDNGESAGPIEPAVSTKTKAINVHPNRPTVKKTANSYVKSLMLLADAQPQGWATPFGQLGLRPLPAFPQRALWMPQAQVMAPNVGAAVALTRFLPLAEPSPRASVRRVT
jgi:hypothetical protein